MIEVQDVFNQYGARYCQTHKLSLVQHKAMYVIKNCRTAKLGGHIDACPNCNHTQISYNSCRNRHCPKCQTLNKERWIENQKINLTHILPQGFMKIRHYGFLSSRGKQAQLPLCKRLTHTKIQDKAKASTEDLLRKILGRSPSLCPCCGYDKLHHYGLSPPNCSN